MFISFYICMLVSFPNFSLGCLFLSYWYVEALSRTWHFILIITGFLCRSTRLFGPFSSITLIFFSTRGPCCTPPTTTLSQVFQRSKLFHYYAFFMSSDSSPGLAPPAPLYYDVSLCIHPAPNKAIHNLLPEYQVPTIALYFLIPIRIDLLF